MCRHYYTFTKAFIGSSASLYNFELFYVIHVFYVYEQFQATSKGYMYLVSAEECLFLSVKPLLLLLLLRGCLPWKIITTILTMASIELLPAVRGG